jgi:hypothetical protein
MAKTLRRDIKKNIGDAMIQAFRRLPDWANDAFAPPGPAPRDAAIAHEISPIPPLDHNDFGLYQSKIMNVIGSKSLERDAGGKTGCRFSSSRSRVNF